jgi:hypothetical protein
MRVAALSTFTPAMLKSDHPSVLHLREDQGRSRCRGRE